MHKLNINRPTNRKNPLFMESRCLRDTDYIYCSPIKEKIVNRDKSNF